MHKTIHTCSTAKIAIVAIAGVLLSSCSATSDWLKGKSDSETGESSILGAPDANRYIEELGRLASNDPAAQAEIFADAHAAARLTPGASTQLRLGLVLAIPGHPESDPEQAQDLLREALSQDLLLTPAEISLAKIHLNNVERLIVASAEARRLRATSSRAQQTEEQAVGQRLATVEAENRRLRRDLEEAEDKLEAITSIERSIREQE